jgi:hypothetical protein
MSPCRWVNWDGNRNYDLVRFDLARQRKRCATQGTLIDVTLDMNLVPTTPHVNDCSCERFETDWTLREVFDFPDNSRVVPHIIKYFANKTLKPEHCPTLVVNEFSFEIRSVNLHGLWPQYVTEVPCTRRVLQGVPRGSKGHESL